MTTDSGPTFDGVTADGTILSETELFTLMWQAASRATEECVRRGLGRGDKITRDSARAAAEETYRQHRPDDIGAAQPAPPLPAEVRESMERQRLL